MTPHGHATAHRPAACLFCGTTLRHTLVDLGMSPLCESYLATDQLNQMEPFYPLHVWVCEQCFLVQVQEYVRPEHIFSDYAYFSSYSDSWLRHAKTYTERMVTRLGLDAGSQVIEVGSNDGYLLQYFVAQGIPVLGIEPAANVARVAVDRGVPTMTTMFRTEAARALGNRRLYPARSLRVVRRAGEGDEAQAPRLPDHRQAPGQVGRRLRCPRQGQHPSELLRHPDGLPRLHGGPEPAQARQVPAGHPHPDLPPR